MNGDLKQKIAVVIPCYKVSRHVLRVISGIGDEVVRIYVVDDACPENSGKLVEKECFDPRVRVIYHEKNQGVGGAVISGYRAALEEGMDAVVKVDGDGQMDTSMISVITRPVLSGAADYVKGNRFYEMEYLQQMPGIRIFGNAVLSFMSKLSSGYWDIFDPTNGYTAISRNMLQRLPLAKVARDYFFESDMLFRLSIARAAVMDMPMRAKYEDEVSNIKIKRILLSFVRRHARNFVKRILYNYYLRDFSIASVNLALGLVFMAFGVVYGAGNWIESEVSGVPATAGTVMISALPIIIGFQMCMSFLNYDIRMEVRSPKLES